MDYSIEFECEEDGRWIAGIPDLPDVMAYGASKQEAESKVQSIALRVIADKLERDHTTTEEEANTLLKEAQAMFRKSNVYGHDLVEKLFAERRADAERG